MNKPSLIILAGSAGAIEPIKYVVAQLPMHGSHAVLILLHLAVRGENLIAEGLARINPAPVVNITDKCALQAGVIYLAPGGYHTLLDEQRQAHLTSDERVNHCRPAIDELFDSLAEYPADDVVAVVFSGANRDGAAGAKRLRERKAKIWVQTPADAQVPEMPEAIIADNSADRVGDHQAIALWLREVTGLAA